MGVAILVAASALFVTPALAQQTGDQAIVDRFSPQWLKDKATAEAGPGGLGVGVQSGFARLDLNGVGAASYLVAAYTNGFETSLSVMLGVTLAIAIPR